VHARTHVAQCAAQLLAGTAYSADKDSAYRVVLFGAMENTSATAVVIAAEGSSPIEYPCHTTFGIQTCYLGEHDNLDNRRLSAVVVDEPDAAYNDFDKQESIYAASAGIASVDEYPTGSTVPKGGHTGAAVCRDCSPAPAPGLTQFARNDASDMEAKGAILYARIPTKAARSMTNGQSLALYACIPVGASGDNFPAPAPGLTRMRRHDASAEEMQQVTLYISSPRGAATSGDNFSAAAPRQQEMIGSSASMEEGGRVILYIIVRKTGN
jgi:hypothetical protein